MHACLAARRRSAHCWPAPLPQLLAPQSSPPASGTLLSSKYPCSLRCHACSTACCSMRRPTVPPPSQHPTPSPAPLCCRLLPVRKSSKQQQLTATERAVAALAAGGSLRNNDQPRRRSGFLRCCGGSASKAQQPETWRGPKDSPEEGATPVGGSPRSTN